MEDDSEHPFCFPTGPMGYMDIITTPRPQAEYIAITGSDVPDVDMSTVEVLKGESASSHLTENVGYTDLVTMSSPSHTVVAGIEISDSDQSIAEALLELSRYKPPLPRYLRQVLPKNPDILGHSRTPPPSPGGIQKKQLPPAIESPPHEDTPHPEMLTADNPYPPQQSTWGDAYHPFFDGGMYLDYLTPCGNIQNEFDMGPLAPEVLFGPEIEREATLIQLEQAIRPFMDSPFPFNTPPS